MYFVSFQRVVKAQEEVYQFMEREQKVFLLSRLLYGLVQIRNTSARRGKGRVKLQELSKKHKSIEWENEPPAPKQHRIYRDKLSLTTTRTSMLLVFYKRKTCKFMWQKWGYQQSSALVWHGVALGIWAIPRHSSVLPAIPISWLLLMSKPSALSSLPVHSSIPVAQVALELLVQRQTPIGNGPGVLTVPKLSLQPLVKHRQLCLHTASYIPCRF